MATSWNFSEPKVYDGSFLSRKYKVILQVKEKLIIKIAVITSVSILLKGVCSSFSNAALIPGLALFYAFAKGRERSMSLLESMSLPDFTAITIFEFELVSWNILHILLKGCTVAFGLSRNHLLEGW